MIPAHDRLKIAFFTCFYPDISGGAEYQSYLLANSLDKNKFDCFFISLSAKRQGYVEENGCRIYFFKAKQSLLSMDKGYLANRDYIRSVIETERPDIVYQRMGNSATGLLTLLARKYRYKFVWACASTKDLSGIGFNIRTPWTLPEELLRVYGIRYAHQVLLQSIEQKKMLEQFFSRSGLVLKNAHPEPPPVIQKSSDTLNVLFIGNFKKLKQPEVFISLAKCYKGVVDVRFIMVGRGANGTYQQQLEENISAVSCLDWVGERTQDQVNAMLDQAHLLVNTSLYEGFSNTFIQAWQRQVPVLSLNVDPDSLLSKARLGMVSGSFERLCQDLKTLVESHDLRKVIGENARRYALEEHSLKRIVDQFSFILHGLVD